ncbi:MAG TPA: RHS repeat-associated core domain-containing protein [Oculatellaceae cyanobacterium]
MSSSTTSILQLVWDDEDISESRDSTGTLISQYFDYGQRTSGINIFATRDQLGSIRTTTNSSAVFQAAYLYDPYGRTTLMGLSSAGLDHQYCGYFTHARSTLALTSHRFYSTGLGRWLSRDPIGENDSHNLYAYVVNNPISLIDPEGLYGSGLEYPGYPITVPPNVPGLGGSTFPIGHAGVLGMDPKTGCTKYYEYGRYASNFGEVHDPTPVPNVRPFNPEKGPDPDDLKKVTQCCAKRYGHGITPTTTPHPNADFNKIVTFCEARKKNKKRKPYSWLPPQNTCYTFRDDALHAGESNE